jgi:hypothetical protein
MSWLLAWTDHFDHPGAIDASGHRRPALSPTLAALLVFAVAIVVWSALALKWTFEVVKGLICAA